MPLDREAFSVTSPSQQLNAFVEIFCQQEREATRQRLEIGLQAQIEALEAGFTGAKQKRSKQFHTPVGTLHLARRLYPENGHDVCKADALLGLPDSNWFVAPEKRACALGVSVEFAHACELLAETTGIALSEHGLANRVKAWGQQAHEQSVAEPTAEVYAVETALHRNVCRKQLPRPVLYVWVEGIHVPLNRGQGCKEAKVGVIFWEAEHFKVSPKRREVRCKEYVGTLESREVFCELVFKRFAEVARQKPAQGVVLGDGAKWIWEMAEVAYPNAIEILDFYHLSEYVWEVARELYAQEPKRQRNWIKPQLKRLKASRWYEVFESLGCVQGGPGLAQSVKNLTSYLQNNAARLDYKRYLALGLMMGSGVVESANRRGVTQRLTQAGMHWSVYGANAVIALRACYLSSSNRWCQFWETRAA